ncbi:MAG: DUF2330 domain-containing protein [Acidimicrobiia bacterium]|nr:DUF2330 domain-containing protein [Acidimicrobiia bacterium]
MGLPATAAAGIVLAVLLVLVGGRPADACGGLFCQNDPVDQVGERIVFSVNADESITSLIEIQYTGSAADFSWILPIPSAITAEDLAVPEEGDTVFAELHALTDVRIVAPPLPECARRIQASAVAEDAASDAESAGVDVFASGEVGPFGFDVIGSDDPSALIGWLRDNEYRVEEPMEPLIDVYVDEQFAFLAMRLLDGEDADSITPIEVTYVGTEPMIPLRLTAVAAAPNMPIFTWIFAEDQAVPANYDHMEIATEELTFSDFGGNDYNRLVRERADALGGRAFITEFAGASSSIELAHPYLQNMARGHDYLTRLTTFISPEEMTVDPVFAVEPGRSDVSNIRDASELDGLYECERSGNSGFQLGGSDAIDPTMADGEVSPVTPTSSSAGSAGTVALGLLLVVGVGGIAAIAYSAGRRGRVAASD